MRIKTRAIKTPYEAFGGDSQKWGEIESLALRSGYPKKKAKRDFGQGLWK